LTPPHAGPSQHGGPGKRFLGKLPGIGGRRNRNLSPAKAERLAKDPRVYALSPDQEVKAYGETIPWGVARIGAPTTTAEGAGVSVYVLDTGIKVGHEDLTNLRGGYAVVKCRGRCAAPTTTTTATAPTWPAPPPLWPTASGSWAWPPRPSSGR